mmetsp:Transcript_34638/g.90068  ORF Transcript_34638/g.90068 Transcript_34638/m.90068 type:complete len:213 (-) Transcript_34638:689-1327(-)
MMAERSGGQILALMGHSPVAQVAAQVVAELVNLVVLNIDYIPQSDLEVLHTGDLCRSVLEHQLCHVHSIDVVRYHLLHKRGDGIAMGVVALHTHLPIHSAVNCLQACLEVCVERALQETLRACACTTWRISSRIKGTTPGIEGTSRGGCIQLQGRGVEQWRAIRLGDRRAIRILDEDPAAHLGVDVAEVVDLSTERRIGHLLGDRELGRVLL